MDRRVRATVSQSPEVDGQRFLKYGRPEWEYDELLSQIERDFVNRYEGGEGERVSYTPPGDPPIADDPSNPNIVAWPSRYQPTLDPMILLSSLEKIIDFQPETVIQHIAPRPLLIVANGGYDSNNEWKFDAGHLLADIQEAFKKAGEPKELVILPYDHFGLYNEPGRGEALAAALDFYQRYLPAKG
jgi:hypothetical protein